MTKRWDDRIEACYRDIDGWWIELKNGWAFDPADLPYGGSHTISEKTKGELRKHLSRIKPCKCACCQQGIKEYDLGK